MKAVLIIGIFLVAFLLVGAVQNEMRARPNEVQLAQYWKEATVDYATSQGNLAAAAGFTIAQARGGNYQDFGIFVTYTVPVGTSDFICGWGIWVGWGCFQDEHAVR